MTCQGWAGETYQIPIITNYLNTFACFHRVH
ncbi:hypothetical protein CsSME_00040234 [Camellia sinensis var. sinensis]